MDIHGNNGQEIICGHCLNKDGFMHQLHTIVTSDFDDSRHKSVSVKLKLDHKTGEIEVRQLAAKSAADLFEGFFMANRSRIMDTLIEFGCENCRKVSGLSILFHKGITKMYIRPLPKEWEWEDERNASYEVELK